MNIAVLLVTALLVLGAGFISKGVYVEKKGTMTTSQTQQQSNPDMRDHKTDTVSVVKDENNNKINSTDTTASSQVVQQANTLVNEEKPVITTVAKNVDSSNRNKIVFDDLSTYITYITRKYMKIQPTGLDEKIKTNSKITFWDRLSIGAGVGTGTWGEYISAGIGGAYGGTTHTGAGTYCGFFEYRQNILGAKIEVTSAKGPMKSGRLDEGYIDETIIKTQEVESNSVSFCPVIFLRSNLYIGVGVEYYFYRLSYSVTNLRDDINGLSVVTNRYTNITNNNGLGSQTIIGWEPRIYRNLYFTMSITQKYYSNTIERLYVDLSGTFYSIGIKYCGKP
ncbi:MAG: hypothetical protein WC955_10385 [Elusimicrobiota bacterium]